MERISPKNSEPCLQKHPAPPKNESLMKPSIRGSPQRVSQGPYCQIALNSPGNSSSTTLQTLNKPNGPSLVPNLSLISLTANGTMSCQENLSTLTLSSLVPFPQPLITAPSNPLESSSFSSEPPSLLKRLQPMETGSLHGELPQEQSRLHSRIGSKNSIPIVTTGYFAAIHNNFHSKILELDKSIRKYVGSVRDTELSDFNKFRYLEARHLHFGGVGSETNTRPKEKAPPKSEWRSSEPCRNWNRNACDLQASRCRYRHVCQICKGNHRKGDCPHKEGHT